MKRRSGTSGIWLPEPTVAGAAPSYAPLRRDLVAGPDPDDPARSLVFCPRTGRRFALPSEALQVAAAFDGRRSPRQVAEALAQGGGPAIAVHVVDALGRDLDGLGLLAPEPAGDPAPPPAPSGQWVPEDLTEDLPVEAHPEARFTCIGAGTCCRSGYLIPVDGIGAERLRRAASRCGLSGDPVVLLPTAPGRRWTHALHNEPRCPFLLNNRCRLHGSDAHPAACQMFPLAFTRVGQRVHVTVTHRCACGVFGDGGLLRRNRTELTRRARLGPVPRIFPFASLDRLRSIDLTGADRLVQVSRGRFEAPERVRAAWSALGFGSEGDPSGPDDWALPATLASLGQGVDLSDDPILEATLGAGEHPAWDRIAEDLRRVGAFSPQASAEAEIDRFVRDHLFGLRVYQHESVVRGLFALSLATADLWWRRADGHPRTRARIMMWEDTFASPGFRGLMGSEGPLGTALDDGEQARAWVERWWAGAP